MPQIYKPRIRVEALQRHHAPTVFDLPPVEYAAGFEPVRELREPLVQKWKTKSLSVVLNWGAEAKQTTEHAQIHLAPGIEMCRYLLPQTFALP